MMKQLSYNIFHSKVIKNSIFHFILISIEYLCLICPAIVSSSLKLSKYNQKKDEFSLSNNSIAIKYINENRLAPILIVSFTSFLILIYYLILYFNIPNWNWFKCIQTILINFFDIVLFRYFSILIIDAFLCLFLDSFLNEFFEDSILSFLFLILSLIYIYTIFSYIQNMAIIFNISNPLLVNKEKKYPYDQLSKEYEIILLLIKICISIENCFYCRQTMINAISITFNALIVLLSIGLFIRFTLFDNWLCYNITNLYANTDLNNLRNAFSIFNFVITLGACLIMPKLSDWRILLFIIFVGMNATIIISYIQYYIINDNHLISQPISYELLLLLLINNHKSVHFKNKYTKIQYHSHLKHRAQCKDLKCILCTHFSTDLKNNFKYFFKFLKRDKPITLYDQTATLLYYKMIKKPFKFFRYYYWLIQQHKKTNTNFVQNITMIVETWLMTENDEYYGIIEDLLSITQLERRMKDLINNFSAFIHTNIKLKRPETVITLSKDLFLLMNNIKTFLSYLTKGNSAFSFMDNTSKNINNVLTYDTIIIRYAIECLINQQLQGLPISNIEAHDDFLQLHYSYDHILICSINLKKTANLEFKLLKVTGNLARKSNSNYTILSDYFSKPIAKDGNQLLYDQVDKSSSTQNEIKHFIFPFILKGTIEYMKYSFRLMKTMKLNSIIIYGQYNKDNKQCLLLDRKESNKIEILAFCPQALKIIFFKKKWIPFLNQINFKFYLHSIFKTVKIKDAQDTINCVLDYKYYLKKVNQINNELRSIDAFKNDESNEKHLQFANDEMKKYSLSLIKVELEKLITYPSGKCLFQMHLKTKDFKKTQNKVDDEKSNWGEDKDNDLLYNYHSTTIQSSVSQSRAYSGSKNRDNSKTKTLEYDILDASLKNQTMKEIKNLNIFSYTMYMLNLLLIITCTVFLVTQIMQTQMLSQLANLMFQHKFLWLYFNNFYITFSYTTCFASESKILINCSNTYIEYSKYAKEFYGLSLDFDFYFYTNKELRVKTDKAQESLLYFKTFISNNNQNKLQLLLTREMVYYEFDQSDIDPQINQVNVTFEEGVRKYINSIFRLTSDEFDYRNTPIYFVTYENRSYSFNNFPSENVKLTQREIYRSFLNYFNFYNAFSLGEKDINNEISSLRKENNIMNIIFMVIVACFNCILLFLCNQNIQSSYNIFTILILNVVYKLENKQILNALKTKMDSLSSLIQLYNKNPNDLIKKLMLLKEKDTSNSPKKTSETNEKEVKIEDLQLQATFDQGFKNFIVGKQLIILFSLFSFFFFCHYYFRYHFIN